MTPIVRTWGLLVHYLWYALGIPVTFAFAFLLYKYLRHGDSSLFKSVGSASVGALVTPVFTVVASLAVATVVAPVLVFGLRCLLFVSNLLGPLVVGLVVSPWNDPFLTNDRAAFVAIGVGLGLVSALGYDRVVFGIEPPQTPSPSPEVSRAA